MPAVPDIPRPLLVAVGLILLEALALVFAAGLLVVKTVTGHPGDLARALLGALLALAGAAVLVFGARALVRLRPAARAPVVVMQLLALPVSYSLWFQAGRTGYGAPIMLAALAVLFLLFTPPVREVLDRQISR